MWWNSEVEQWNSVGRTRWCKSDGGIMLRVRRTVLVEQCCGTVEQWGGTVEQ